MSEQATLLHTGLQVPHKRIRMRGPGVITYDGQIAGTVTFDHDDDFAKVFTATGAPPTLTADAFFDWAAGCRILTGDPVDAAEIFDWLEAEYHTERALRWASLRGETIAQAMEPHGETYMPGGTIRVLHTDTRAVVIARSRLVDVADGSWWRIFNGSGWDELDPSQSIG
jgi:hypothetical protein